MNLRRLPFPEILAVLLILLGSFAHGLDFSADEARPWVIANVPGLSDWSELFRFEGHPPLWYLVLKFVSAFSSSPVLLQLTSALLGLGSFFLLLRRSPFDRGLRLLLCCNVYLLYQYTILARLYSLELFLLLLLCHWYVTRWSHRSRYLALLCCLSFTSAFGAGFAGIFLLEFVLTYLRERRREKKTDLLVAASGASFLLVFLFLSRLRSDPASTHHLPLDWFILGRWEKIFSYLGASYFLALEPGSTWGRALGLDRGFLNSGYLLLVFFTWGFVIWQLRSKRRALGIFLGTTSVTVYLLYAIRFSSFNLNYYGHATLALLMALWVFLSEEKSSPRLRNFLLILFSFQAISGAVCLVDDLRLPYSRGQDVAAHLESKGVEEIIPGLWYFTSSSLVHAPLTFYDPSRRINVRFRPVTADAFRSDEYEFARIPRAFTGIINKDDHGFLLEAIRARHCTGVTQLRVITHSRLPEAFLKRSSLVFEKSFTGAIHPLENFYVYAFARGPGETPLCQN